MGYVSLLKEKDRMALMQLYILYRNKDYRDLIHHPYIQHPNYTFHIERAERFLDASTSLGVEYLHLPEAGIISEQRQELT